MTNTNEFCTTTGCWQKHKHGGDCVDLDGRVIGTGKAVEAADAKVRRYTSYDLLDNPREVVLASEYDAARAEIERLKESLSEAIPFVQSLGEIADGPTWERINRWLPNARRLGALQQGSTKGE